MCAIVVCDVYASLPPISTHFNRLFYQETGAGYTAWHSLQFGITDSTTDFVVTLFGQSRLYAELQDVHFDGLWHVSSQVQIRPIE